MARFRNNFEGSKNIEHGISNYEVKDELKTTHTS